MVRAWEFGLAADGNEEWEERYRQLAQYRESRGDPHVGFRDGDDSELTRYRAGGSYKGVPGFTSL